MTSLSLPRFQLDHLLVQKVMEQGVDVRERHAVDDFLFEDNRVTGVKGRDEANRPFTFSASVVVDASGRNGLSLRRLGLIKPHRGPGKIALAAHWENAQFPQDYCYMHISSPGYTGMAPVGNDSVNVVLVVEDRHVKGQELDAFYQTVVLGNERRQSLLAGARLKERVRSVGSLAYDVRPVRCGGLVLAGDTTGFIDPFTGEGIYLSLRSAQLAAGVIHQAFAAGTFQESFWRSTSGRDRRSSARNLSSAGSCRNSFTGAGGVTGGGVASAESSNGANAGGRYRRLLSRRPCGVLAVSFRGDSRCDFPKPESRVTTRERGRSG